MTIALGAACKEGALLVTDSMRVDWEPAWPTIDLDGAHFGPKLAWLADRRIGAIASGCFTEVWRPAVVSSAPGFEAVAAALFGEVMAIRAGSREAHMVVAGSAPGDPPRVAFLATDRPSRYLSPEAPGIVVGGAMSAYAAEYGLEAQSIPPTMAAAVAFAVAACREYITESYRGWGIEHLLDPAALREEVTRPGGAVPPVAFPLHVATFAGPEVTEWEISA